MSDVSNGADWWQASDGKWYPPESLAVQTDQESTSIGEAPALLVTPPISGAEVGASGAGPNHPPVIVKSRLTAAEGFWYVLQCIAFGAGYFAKIPAKKALSEVGIVELTGAENFWYVLQCIAFGSGYLAKVPIKKALSEAGIVELTSGEGTWYLLLCIAFGAGYFTKVPVKKAFSDVGLVQMTDGERTWYLLMCIAFGSGYFSKVPYKKALNEVAQLPSAASSS
jgi:hypothetical protein